MAKGKAQIYGPGLLNLGMGYFILE